MKRLTRNSKYENRYLLTEEISYDPKTGNQVWAVTDSETDKRLLGRFQGNGKVEWFDDTRPKAKTSTTKIEEKSQNIIPSISSIPKSTEKIISISSLTNTLNSKKTEKSKPFVIPQNNKKSTSLNTINSFNALKLESELKQNTKSKLPLYIGVSLLGLCLVIIGYNKKEIILSKIAKPKIEETKVDSTINVIQEMEVGATPNLPEIEIEKPKEGIIEDTLKPNADMQLKTENVKSN